MGFGGVSPWSLLLIFLIVICLFGTKRLRNLGSDLGEAIRNFRENANARENENHHKDKE